MSQIVSKQRVADHGEVYTHEREVNAMLDLVADQAANPEKRFLEPACGTGNFLVEILRRKLQTVAAQNKASRLNYEREAVIAVGSIYGIDLLPDNVQKCRVRLLEIFQQHYQTAFPKEHRAECLNAARYILSQNIVCGDALTMCQADGEPLTLSEWSRVNGSKIKRRDFRYSHLINRADSRDLPLFSDLGEEAYVPDSVKNHPTVSFVEIGNV